MGMVRTTNTPPDDDGRRWSSVRGRQSCGRGRTGRLRVRTGGPAGAAASRPDHDGDDQADEIQRLADLHASGALTDEEFAAAKAKALGI